MLPDLPKIPTDNLYKFAAITGVLFLIVGMGLLPSLILINKVRLKEITAREKNVSRKVRQFDVATRAYSILDSITDMNLQMKKKLDLISLNEVDSLKKEIEFNSQQSEIYVARLKREDSLSKILYENSDYERNSLLNEFAESNVLPFVLSVIFTAVGGYSLFWGFKNWYNKLQKPLDLIYEKNSTMGK